ncbi:MAG: hypothetical protein IPK00_17700 [Deltaproteobacteria bacterium]|nr:hypothetical protein [Deltaproteobacteria bacterium]
MPDARESNEDRLARRRARRWSRRARIFAPFVAVPAMLGVLMLSVNLIEHRPDANRKASPSDRPAAQRIAARGSERAASAPTPFESGAGGVVVDGDALSQHAVIATAVAADRPLTTDVQPTNVQPNNPAATLFGPPAPMAGAAGAD